LWTCGCVFSERALKELKSNTCSVCQTPYTEEDVVILNGNEKDTDSMRTKMDARVARLKAAKKEKKSKEETVVKQEEIPCASKSLKDAPKVKPETSSKSKPILTFKPSIAAHKRELLLDPLGSDPNSKKVKKDYSIAQDPKNTEVYKSLFTSHESEQKQDRAHWVTFNPHYY
jgi:hypothetical protein